MATTPKGKGFITRFMIDGERHTKVTKTRTEGEAWELEARAALKLGKPLPQGEKKLGGSDAGTIGNLLRETIKMHWSKAKGSHGQVTNATTFMKWCGDAMSIREAFAQDTLDEFFEHLTDEREVAPGTMNRYASAISTMADRVSKLLGDDMGELPRFKESRGRYRYFSREEEANIAGLWTLWGKTDEVDFLTFLIDTGARTFKEGGAIEWNSLQEDRAIFWNTKNGSFRSVPLSDRAKAAVARMKLKHHNTQAGPFRHLGKSYMRHLWTKTRAQFPPLDDAVLYCTRHTYGSRMVMEGVPLSALKTLMGHSDIKMTEKYAVFEDSLTFALALQALNSPTKTLPVVGVVATAQPGVEAAKPGAKRGAKSR